MGDDCSQGGSVVCGSWIKRPDNAHLAVIGRLGLPRSPSASSLQILFFDVRSTSLSSSPKAACVLEEGEPVAIAVHPSGDHILCATTSGGCKLFELSSQEADLRLLPKELSPLEAVGPQNCVAFSADGSRLATGGRDGHLRIFEWPSLRIVLDEPRADKPFRDMDFSLDSNYLASTSSDGSARIWKADDGLLVTSLSRNTDEKIELCRFSKDGTKPFLFCTVQKGDEAVTGVWDMSTWNKIGFKRLLRKPATILSVSLDGKFVALGSRDGDICVVDVKRMEPCHWIKRLHPGTCIASLEFCPSERVVLTASGKWGAKVTRINIPAEWKEWQIYLLLLGCFLVSLAAFYIFFENSDSFWNFPVERAQPSRPEGQTMFQEPQFQDEQNMWEPFGPLDM